MASQATEGFLASAKPASYLLPRRQMQAVGRVTDGFLKAPELSGEVALTILPANLLINDHAQMKVQPVPSPRERDAKRQVLE